MTLSTDEKETARVEAFSDGVFAIAITLLVLDLKVPREHLEGEALWDVLLHQWPAYFAFLTSFATIGIMWINHHRLFTHIRRVDHGLLVLNLLLLLGVTVVPFPTSLVAEHHTNNIAAVVYCGTYVVIALMFNLLWRHARGGGRLLRADVNQEAIAIIDKQYSLGAFLYLPCLAMAFFSVALSVGMSLALAVYFALPERLIPGVPR